MSEIGARLVEGADAIELRHRGAAEAAQLREDEPHPVAALLARLQLAKRDFEDRRLRRHESLEVEGIVGFHVKP